MSTQMYPTELNATSFDAFIESTSLPVVIDFWASWCGPCKMMAPHFEEASRQMEGQALFAKVNTDDASAIAARFGIRSIPTLIVLHKGREIGREAGAKPAGQIVSWVASLKN